MLAKLTSKNQLTLPKAIVQQIDQPEYFDVSLEDGRIVLTPMPKKGNIIGTDLLLLQGLVCLLKDSDALVAHAQKVIEGYGPAFVLDALLAGPDIIHESDGSAEQIDDIAYGAMDDEPVLPDIPEADNTRPHPAIPSLGLW